jgi:hypothetical protein
MPTITQEPKVIIRKPKNDYTPYVGKFVRIHLEDEHRWNELVFKTITELMARSITADIFGNADANDFVGFYWQWGGKTIIQEISEMLDEWETAYNCTIEFFDTAEEAGLQLLPLH